MTGFVPEMVSKHRLFDTVMSDWIGEFNLPRIVASGRRAVAVPIANAPLQPYLRQRAHEIELERAVR